MCSQNNWWSRWHQWLIVYAHFVFIKFPNISEYTSLSYADGFPCLNDSRIHSQMFLDSIHLFVQYSLNSQRHSFYNYGIHKIGLDRISQDYVYWKETKMALGKKYYLRSEFKQTKNDAFISWSCWC